MKVMTIVGTRPELIRLACVIHRLETTPGIEHVLVHTGQNYDYGLNQVFFDDLRLPAPNHMLGVDTSSLGTVLGGILIATEKVLKKEKPDAVLVLGDTNSCVSAIMAKRMKIPVYHMEAGNRSFDENVPEETNRRLVDHVADFNLAYTEHARRNLLAEGIHPRRIAVTGSPMREVLDAFKDQISSSNVVERLRLEPRKYFLVSAHREENVDSPARLRQMLKCLEAVKERWNFRVIVSTHPRSRKRLTDLRVPLDRAGIEFMPPFGFLDYIQLQRNAACVLSDSGTISEEASILQFPAVTLRDSIERPEALESGAIMMTGLDQEDVVQAVQEVMHSGAFPLPDGYEIGDTSTRVVRFIMSTAGRHHQWSGIRQVLEA